MAHCDLEPELIQRATTGDRAALAQLLLIHHDSLRQHIVHASAGRQTGVMLTDDILQQTFVRVAQNISRFENGGPGSFRGWLKTIATNLINDAQRRRGRERRAARPATSQSDDGSFGDAVGQLSCDHTPPIKRVQRSESIRRLRDAIANLPVDQREIVERYYLQAQTLEQIAAATGRTISAIRGTCYRARKTMRGLMGGSSLYFSS